MKFYIKSPLLVYALLAGMSFLTGSATAQTFTTLYNFTNSPDGSFPKGNLILSGNALYGTAKYGGTNDSGIVFAISTNGSNYTILHTCGLTNSSDGADPANGLVLSGSTLYGTASAGGAYGYGAVFALNTNGSGFTNLHNFSTATYVPAISRYTNNDGTGPFQSAVVLGGNTLYGTAFGGGLNGVGTVFSLNTNGSNFLVLHTFGPSALESAMTGNVTNSDGIQPESTLLLAGNTLYGTAAEGGTNGFGTVFAMGTNGSNFMVLHTFGPLLLDTNLDQLTNDGFASQGSALILSGNTLYGTTSLGGFQPYGTVFALNTNGSNFMDLHDFTNGPDGASPYSGLILSGNKLYGAATGGGTHGFGTVFTLDTSGSNFMVLYTFNAATNGYASQGLILAGNTFYGTTADGGSTGDGTVFSLTVTLPVTPYLAIVLAGTNVILNWPTNAAGFTLESTTNLASPSIWITNAPPPVAVGTNYTVTNGISGTMKFYRLSQ